MSFPGQFRLLLCAALLAALPSSSLIAADGGEDLGSIRVGGGDNFAPYHFKDDSGEPAGFDIDLVRAVGRVMGIDLEIELGPWKTQRLALESGDIDMLAGLSLSRAREEIFLFSRPYLLAQYKIFVRADDTTIHDAADLKGKRIIVQRDGVMEDFVRTRGYAEDPVRVSTAREGLQLLASGRYDCYLTGEYRGLFVMNELGLNHLTRRGQPLFIADYGFAVNRSRSELVERLNLGLDIVKASGEYDRLVQRWFGVYDPAPITRKLMLYGTIIILPLLFILILSLAWTRTLRKKVAKQTHALQQELRKREQLEDELVQARKMEAIGKLAGGVAHDFNNILLAIQGFGEMIRDDLAKDDPVRRNVEQILKASGRATSLTNQMLAFSRRQVLQPKIVDLNKAVSDIRRMIERLIGAEIDLRLNLDPDLGKVRVDPGQFDQVVVNLMMNARDALPDGGRITITTANVTFTENSTPPRSDIPPGRYVSLETSDTGHGITKENLARIFEPFFTTRKQGQGTGLGLSTVYGIVKQSGGYLHVESEPGRGATFRIFLPRDDSRAETENVATEHALPQGSDETILLAEDQEDVCELIQEILTGSGYTVLASLDPEEASRIAREHEGSIDLLITDVVMPGMNGAELAAQVRSMHDGVSVLYISGYTEHPAVRNEVEKEGSAFLQKPFSNLEIASKVRELLDNKVPDEARR